MVSPILVALDLSDITDAENLARAVAGEVGGFKIGLELLMSEGPDAVSRIGLLGKPILVDAKLHDVPNTVRRAASRIGTRGARWITVHAAGGREMLAAAISGFSEGTGGRRGGVLAVTVLTSLDERDLTEAGACGSLPEQVIRLAGLAHQAGVEGVVCSPGEVELVKTVSEELLAVTPGIRTEGRGSDDQKRVATPNAAIGAGADLLVVGRPITQASDPVAAVAAINAELAAS